MAKPAATQDNMDWQDALEDVHTRFILNLPPSELETADRIFFQVEQAWWFYEDFICDTNPDKDLPRFNNLKPFALKLFEFSPLLPDASSFASMWTEFSKYKRKISNYGCILLNEDCTKVVLCQVWNGKSHTFPSGKINQGEHAVEAAARETYEETGFDPNCLFGHTFTLKQEGRCTWKTPLRENDALVFQEQDGKRRTNYVCRGVPEDFPFAPVARKEVSRIAWYPLDQIPKPNFAVQPFMSQLYRWIKRNTRGNSNARQTPRRGDGSQGRQTPNRRDGSSQSRRTPNRSRQNSRQRVRGNDSDLVQTGLAQQGDASGWSEEDMFAANERLLGRKVTYDGNPHVFEKGFGGQDPHAFHVVGDGFMNSAVQSLAPPPQTSKLQPLFRKGDAPEDDDDDLRPFFSDEGITPWGDAVKDVSGSEGTAPSSSQSPRAMPAAASVTTNPAGSSIMSMLQGAATTANSKPQTTTTRNAVIAHEDGGLDTLFLTDAEITARSQAQKTATTAVQREEKAQARRVQYEADMAFLTDWVARLPKPPVTKHFGEFKLDAEAIVEDALRRARQGATTTTTT